MERKQNFQSLSDLSSVSYSSDYYNNSPHLPLCEWEEHHLPWRPLSSFSDGSDTDSQISANSSRIGGSLDDTLGKALKELLETKRELLKVASNRPFYAQKDPLHFFISRVDQTASYASKLKKKAFFSKLPWTRRSMKIVESKKSTISDLNTLKIVAKILISRIPHLRESRELPSSIPVIKPLTMYVNFLYGETLSCLQKLVLSGSHRIVGLHGARGIGKTSILQLHCKDIAKKKPTYTIMWITIQDDSSILQIRQDIAKKLNIPRHTSPSVLHTLRCLTNFVLILDGLKDVLDLDEVGIPQENPGWLIRPYFFSCIIISSISEVVCRRMGASECLEVPLLESEKSLQIVNDMVSKPWKGWTREVVLGSCLGLLGYIIDFVEAVKKAMSFDEVGPDLLAILVEYFAKRDPFDIMHVALEDGSTRNAIIPWVGKTASGASIIISSASKASLFPIRQVKRSRKLVGREDILYRIRELVIDESIHVIGVHGIRGIGKTRILEEFHDELDVLSGIVDFDVLIWITIPDNTSISTIQQEITDQLNPPSKSHHDSLSDMRFLLIIDGLRGTLKLDQLGIPLPIDQSKCKIVVSSRSVEVCRLMGANDRGCIGVPLLEFEESYQLFRDVVNEVGEAPWERGVVELVRSCGGLPLALVGVGETMKKDPTSNLFETGPLSLMTIL